jgi:inosose dehydratase
MLDPQKVKLGIAPIGWTNDDMPELGSENTFQQTISEMALAGFTGCEIGSKYPQDKEELKWHLDLRGMTICNAWFSSMLTAPNVPYEETIQAFRAHAEKLYFLGARVIGVSEQGNSIQGRLDLPILKNKPVYSAEQWATVIKGFNEMGQIAKDMGMAFTCHHHMGTGVQTAEEIDYLMDNTDPNLVFLLFDTGHCTFAGIDYVPVLKKHINRIKHIHLKDLRLDVYEEVKAKDMCFLDAVRAGVFTVPGDGDVDFRPLVTVLEESGYEGWVVVEAEQDPAKANPFEYAKKARKYIAEVTGL